MYSGKVMWVYRNIYVYIGIAYVRTARQLGPREQILARETRVGRLSQGGQAVC